MMIHEDVRKPSPGTSLATKEPQIQDRLHKRLIKHFSDIKESGIELRKHSATDELTLIARGVPLNVDLNAIYTKNLGLVSPGSVKRLSRAREGKSSHMDDY